MPLDDEQLLRQTVRRVAEGYEVTTEEPVHRDGYRPVTELDIDRLDEWKQHLIDLEYLPDTAENRALSEYGPALLAAVRAFVDEAREWLGEGLGGALEPRAMPQETHGQGADTAPSPVALQLLCDLLSLDGGMPIRALPEPGATGLATRVLHYRLATLHLYTPGVAEPVGPETLRALSHLGRLCPGDEPGLPLIGQIGDVSALLRRYSRPVDQQLLVALDVAPETAADEDYAHLVFDRGQFHSRAWLASLRGRRSGRARHARIRREMEERDTPEGQALRPHNRFGLELIQVGLWSLGFYRGRLDAWWGPSSHVALQAFLDFHEIERREVLRYLPNGHCAINVARLVEVLAPATEGPSVTVEQQLAFVEAESPLLEERPENPGLLAALWGGIRDTFRSALHLGRRVAHGLKGLARSALDGLRHGYHWLRARMGELGAPLVSFLRLTYRGAREGVRMLARSIAPFVHFIMGRPLVTRDTSGQVRVLSRFEADKDAVLVVPAGTPAALIGRHAAHCRGVGRGVELFCRFAGQILYLLTRGAGGPVGWLQIGVRLGTTLRHLLLARLAAHVL